MAALMLIGAPLLLGGCATDSYAGGADAGIAARRPPTGGGEAGCRASAEATSERVDRQVEQLDDGNTGQLVGALIGSHIANRVQRRIANGNCPPDAAEPLGKGKRR